jgi:hypothetical protein
LAKLLPPETCRLVNQEIFATDSGQPRHTSIEEVTHEDE